MIVLAIDPGPTHSAFVEFDSDTQRLLRFEKATNEIVLTVSKCFPNRHLRPIALVYEMIASYGMPVGAPVFETCLWIGRFIETCNDDSICFPIFRKTVAAHMCGTVRAKGSNIRQALIDRFGPGKQLAIGTKKAPGPLYRVKDDVWSALAVAVTFTDKLKGSA